MNVLAALQVAEAVAAKQSVTVTLADAATLYNVWQGITSKTFDPTAMAKANALEPAVAALARTATLLDGLLADKTQAPAVVELLQSFKS